MKKIVIITLIAVSSVFIFASCRPNTLKQAGKLVEKYGGKIIKSTEKNNIMLKYGDDVIRNVTFQKQHCYACKGTGQIIYYGEDKQCSNCEGKGYTYKLKMK